MVIIFVVVDFFKRDLNNRIYIRRYNNIINNKDENNKGITLLSLRMNSKIYIKEEENNMDYFICFENNSRIIRELSCGHEFYINCIEKWFCKKKSCPNCRKKL